MRILNSLVVLVLAALFLFAGVDKILHFEGFRNALGNYALVPGAAVPYLAPVIILIELMIGGGLLFKRSRRSAAGLAVLVLGAFTIALAVNHQFGGLGICGCWFTVTLAEGTSSHLVQNLAFMALASLVWWETGSEGADRHARDARPVAAA